MNKISVIFELLRQGAAVADPAKWKNRQISTNALAALLVAIIQALPLFGGVALPIDAGMASALAAGFLAVFNAVMTVTTSDKVGLPASR